MILARNLRSWGQNRLRRQQKRIRLTPNWKSGRANGGFVTKKSTKDQVEGKFHELKGKAKEKAGKARNNPDQELEGQDEKVAGKVQKQIGQVEKVLER
jgi:uncharacterized protein YjbJ (UPF0337 family)